MPLFETERFRLRHGDDYLRGRYNIGNWAWELSALPAHWRHAFDYMDEVWAISPWLQQAYASISRKPVVYMPPLVHLPAVESFDLAELGFSGSHFVFLTFCDFNSYSARKNPVGAVRAFQRAFPARTSSERLIVKTLNGHSQTESLKQLLVSIDDDPRVIVVDGAYSRPKTLGLIQAADCFVSLHRSEGFGRVIAESMLLETPVIATGYSGSNVLLDEFDGLCRRLRVEAGGGRRIRLFRRLRLGRPSTRRRCRSYALHRGQWLRRGGASEGGTPPREAEPRSRGSRRELSNPTGSNPWRGSDDRDRLCVIDWCGAVPVGIGRKKRESANGAVGRA